MRINKVEAITHPDFPNLIHVKVSTDSGVYGVGESYYFGKSVAAFITEFAGPAILGMDPSEIEKISRKLTTYIGALSSGVETRARSQKVRDAVGNKINLMLELHSLWSPKAAKKIFEATKELELTWIEDPIYPDLLDDYAQLRGKGYAPIANGETLASVSRVKALLEKDYIDVLTLDLGWCGGFTTGIEFSKLASKYNKQIAPHDCTGPIGLISGTHLSTARDNAVVQETVRASLRSWYPKMVKVLPSIKDGMITLDNKSGLGTDLTDEFLNSPAIMISTTK